MEQVSHRQRLAAEKPQRLMGALTARILIADDHEVVRSGLRTLLESHAGWSVVAEAADGKAAVLKALETQPDIAVLDYSMPLLNGVEATRQIRNRSRSEERRVGKECA